METKHKVIAIFIMCLGFFFVLHTKQNTKEVSIDITTEAKIESSMSVTYGGNSVFTQAKLMEIANRIGTNKKLVTKEAETTVIKEIEVAQMEAKKEEVTNETESLSEDSTITTLSLSEPEIAFDKVLPKVNEYLNIRAEAEPDGEVVGKLYKNSYGIILERGKEWTKIKSGSVTGYANNEFLYFDDEAIAIAKSQKAFQVVITAGSVNIRTKPTTDSEVIVEAKEDDTFLHVPEMDEGEWVAILYEEETIAYVSKEYIDTKFVLKTAVSKEEEEEAKRAEELEKALQEAKKFKPDTTNREAITLSDEELYLLATVVAMEALSEPYEGKLAVANVVVNRMLDGYWGDSISDVVYAKGQFSGANSGRVKQFESKVTESCKKAAVEALAGNNNIGNYMYFIMKDRAKYNSYTKYYILGCHCFYSRA